MKRFIPLFAIFIFCAMPLLAQDAKMQDGFYFALKYDREIVSAMVGDGKVWRVLKQIPRTELGGQPLVLRAGKLSLQADNRDHAMPGELGSCRIENVSATGQTNPNYNPQFKSEKTNPLLTEVPVTLAKSSRPETKIELTGGTLKISSVANSAAFGEWLLNPQIVDEATFSCRVWKDTDKGLSWGPGLALVWSNGQFILINARDPLGEWSVTTREGETIIR